MLKKGFFVCYLLMITTVTYNQNFKNKSKKIYKELKELLNFITLNFITLNLKYFTKNQLLDFTKAQNFFK